MAVPSLNSNPVIRLGRSEGCGSRFRVSSFWCLVSGNSSGFQVCGVWFRVPGSGGSRGLLEIATLDAFTTGI